MVLVALGGAAAGGSALAADAAGGGWGPANAVRRWIAQTIEKAVSGPDLQVTIGTIGGAVPFNFTIDEVSVADRQGVWLKLEQLHVNLAPTALLTGRAKADVVEAQRVTVERAPLPADPPAPQQGPTSLLPSLPVGVAVGQLKVDELRLAEPLLGQAAVLRVEGSLDLASGGSSLETHLAVDRIDSQPGQVKLDAAFNPDEKRLDLNLKALEPAGGLIAKALAIPGEPPVAATLDGQGTLDDWKGTLTATAENAARLNADATVKAVPEGHAVTLAAGGDVAALLGPQVAPLVGPQPALNGTVLVAPDGALTLRPVAVQAAAGTATLNGTVGADRRTLNLTYEVAAGPDSALHGLAPDIAWREGVVTGSAAGTLDALTVAVQGVIRDLYSNDPAISAAAGPEVRLDGRARLSTGDGNVQLEGLTLTSAAATATAQGSAAGWGQTADMTLALTADDLSRLSGLAGRPLGGAVTVQGPVRRAADGAITAELNGDLRNLDTGTPADAVLGDAATLRLAAGMEPGGAMRLNDLNVDGRNGRLTGTAALVDNRVDAKTRLEIADLAPVGEKVGTEMAGTIALDATANGPLDALAAEAKLNARGLTVQGRRFGATDLTATAANLPSSPRGRINARTELAGAGLTADAAYALEGQVLQVSDLALANGANRITGAVRVALDALTATGKLDGTLPQLKTLSELAGVPLDGAAGFTVALDAPNGKQAATLTANANNLRVEGQGNNGGAPLLVARRITANADVADALGSPTGKARLELLDGAAAGNDLARVTASVDGSLAKAGFRAEAAGAGRDPLALDLAGNFAQDNGLNRIRLDRLQGRYMGESFRLTQAANVALGDRRYEVKGLQLVSGNARLVADLGMVGDRLSGELRLDQVPMALARLASPTLRLDGTLNAQATLGGTLARPRAEATVRVANLKAQQATQAGVPGVDATVNARWQDQRVSVTGNAATRNGAGRINLTAGAPLVMNADTMAVSVPERGALEGALNGTIDASIANDLLAATGDRARGALNLDVRVGGTVGKPQLGGVVTLQNARYENRASGAIIRNINARIVGTGDVFTIESFTANTANGGALGVRGVIRPGATETQQLDLQIQADNARLAQNDLATADIGASLSLTGTFTNPRLAGPIRIQRADIQIPNQTPPNVVDLKVVEVGGRHGNGAKDKVNGKPANGQPAAEAPFAMALDLTVQAQNQIFVRGRGLESEFSADLRVAGTSSQPLVTGRLTMLKGSLDLLGKSFDFKRGIIEFDGGPQIDPRLDLLAEASANNITANVVVGGTAKQPKLELTSPQGLPQDEVLSGVLFGKSVSSLSAGEAVQLAQSAATLAGFGGGGGGLLTRVRKSLGVDRLEFTSGENGRGGAVQAGRYVSDRVYVGVEQGIGANQSRATVEVDITKNIKAEADMGADSETRLGVKWEWNY
ncbi:translocation/assembly module TamB domain-containing protein [Azospirillum rugosum]|uniref:Translocation and assembly module TamB n=2 Tax=Azospirillum rugosum TaxID=416170 RepID=A0ABS4SLN9_9PROT|nr:translocation/assembly module TamB domain-containing protein [Azospirillum rugosum]MBP2293435.1 translocation and assembly module TamB [Azospirillum rugosum]MDQ0530206.1 translocation and assembly module TamB [Azospirillum rugosum]